MFRDCSHLASEGSCKDKRKRDRKDEKPKEPEKPKVPEMTAEEREMLEFEAKLMKKMGFAFSTLMVWPFKGGE